MQQAGMSSRARAQMFALTDEQANGFVPQQRKARRQRLSPARG
jgi:hypothetical protein